MPESTGCYIIFKFRIFYLQSVYMCGLRQWPVSLSVAHMCCLRGNTDARLVCAPFRPSSNGDEVAVMQLRN